MMALLLQLKLLSYYSCCRCSDPVWAGESGEVSSASFTVKIRLLSPLLLSPTSLIFLKQVRQSSNMNQIGSRVKLDGHCLQCSHSALPLSLFVPLCFTHIHTHRGPIWMRYTRHWFTRLSFTPSSLPFHTPRKERDSIIPLLHLFVNFLLNFAAVNAARVFLLMRSVRHAGLALPSTIWAVIHSLTCDPGPCFNPGWHKEEISHFWPNVPPLSYSNRRIIYVTIYKLNVLCMESS